MILNERFKSPNKEFEKVFGLFRKKDYFDEKSQVKRKQEEFVRFLKKGDPMATKVFKQNKENMKSSLSSIEDMVMDYNKKNHFEAFKIFSTAVNDVEMKDSKSAERSGNFIKSKIHNNSQKYSLGIYSAIRKQKFNNYKDVHKDVDELISKNEGFSSDAQRKAAFANGYEEKGKKKNESVNEGKKRYYQQDRVGSAKYTISYHDGKKKHKDGSDFFDIQTFKHKKDLAKFVNTLHKGGYVYGFNESVNEGKRFTVKKLGDDYYPYGLYYDNRLVSGLQSNSKKEVEKAMKSISKVLGIKESVNEGKKRYYQKDGIGKAKYTISYHDGKKKHKDGSDFFDIQIFRNKKDLAKFVNSLHKGGYVYGFGESVNERINPKFYDARVQYIDPKSKKKFVGDVVRYDNGEYKVNLGKDGRFEKYILAKEKDLKIVSKSKKRTFESVNEILTIVDKFDAKKQDYDKMYYKDGGDRPGDGNLKKANKELERLSKKHKGLTLVSVGRNSKMYDVHNSRESVNEAKYNYKADALTAYFKGKIDAKELDRIARDDFKSGIATKKELSNFLSNKFTQDVMSDTYGIPAGTLIKRVRGLMKFAEGIDIVDQAFLKAKPVKESEDGVPQGYNPMVESKTKESKVVQMIYKYEKNEKKFYDKMAEHERRIGPRDYGKFIINALRGFGINPREFKRVPDAEEKLYQTVSKK